MIVKEQRLEGDFRRAHGRLITNAEEVAFLKGASTEREILNSKLNALINTKAHHHLQNIKKSVVDNILKFQVGSMNLPAYSSVATRLPHLPCLHTF